MPNETLKDEPPQKAPPAAPARRMTPREVIPGLRLLMEAIPDTEFVRHSSGYFAQGGFRPNSKASLLRSTISHMIVPNQELSPALAVALRRNSRVCAALQLLAPRAIKANFDDLAAVCGPDRLAAAAWLDERDEVHQLAIQKIPALFGESPSPAPPADEAAARLRETLDPLFSAFGVAPPDSREDPAKAEALKSEIALLKSENRRLRDFEDRYNRAAKRERDLEADTRAIRARLEAAQRETAAEAARASAAEADARKLRDDAELEIASAVEQRTAAAFAGLLARHAAVAAEVASGATADIVARARAAIENQRQADAASGTFGAARERLREVEEALARVNEALADAIHPLPSLQKSSEELAAEAGRLRALLGENMILQPDSPFAAALAAAAGSAGPDTLHAVSATIENLASFGALGGGEADHLRFLLRMRQDLIHATAAPAAAAGAPAPKDSAAAPFEILASALRGERPAIVLVDGHNTLFALQSRYIGDADGQKPTAAARERLVADFRRIAGGHPTVRVWIVFDGDLPSDYSAADNVRVSYSGGTGEHRADKVLVANARFFARAKAENILLVTNDNGLAGEAGKAGALRLPPGHLIPLL